MRKNLSRDVSRSTVEFIIKLLELKWIRGRKILVRG